MKNQIYLVITCLLVQVATTQTTCPTLSITQTNIIDPSNPWTTLNLYLELQTIFPKTYLNRNVETTGKNVLMIFLDKSGSMDGTLWNNLQESVRQLATTLFPAGVTTPLFDKTIVGYFSDTFDSYEFSSSSSMIDSINQEYADGSTNIQDCFEFIQNFDEPATKSLTIMFLSDGYATDSQNTVDLQNHLSYLKQNYGIESQIFAIGFGIDHDVTFMSNLATLGSNAGYYFTDTDSLETLVDSIDLIVESYGNSQALIHFTNTQANYEQTFKAKMTDYWFNDYIVEADIWIPESVFNSQSEIQLTVYGQSICLQIPDQYKYSEPPLIQTLNAQVAMGHFRIYEVINNYLIMFNETDRQLALTSMTNIQDYMNEVVSVCRSSDPLFDAARNLSTKAYSIQIKLESPETSNDVWIADLNNEAILSFYYDWQFLNNNTYNPWGLSTQCYQLVVNRNWDRTDLEYWIWVTYWSGSLWIFGWIVMLPLGTGIYTWLFIESIIGGIQNINFDDWLMGPARRVFIGTFIFVIAIINSAIPIWGILTSWLFGLVAVHDFYDYDQDVSFNKSIEVPIQFLSYLWDILPLLTIWLTFSNDNEAQKSYESSLF